MEVNGSYFSYQLYTAIWKPNYTLERSGGMHAPLGVTLRCILSPTYTLGKGHHLAHHHNLSYNGTGNHLSIGSTSSAVKFFICLGVRSHMACVIMSSVTIVAKESTKFSAAQCRFACLVATV